MKYKILLVDDHLVVQAGVSYILTKKINNLEIACATNYFETLQFLKTSIYDLIILDINILGGKGTAMIADIRTYLPTIKILMFSAHEEDSYALRYVFAGANGYLNKLSGQEKIVEAVKAIMTNGNYLTSDIVDQLKEFKQNNKPLNPFEKLSNREMEITKLLIKGEGNLEISNYLGLKMSTISTYKIRVFEKLKISNLVELIEKYNLFID
jgi:DNA-binding NarL/FixJ family response regulator